MRDARYTLLRTGASVQGWGVRASTTSSFGGSFVLADVALARENREEELVVASHVLALGEISMAPARVRPLLARMVAGGLSRGSPVPLAERVASPDARTAFAAEGIEMAFCSVDSIREGLIERFAGSA